MEFLGLNINQLIAITIFAISMIIIISEKVHRATVAICGAMLCLIFGVVQFSDPENPASYGDRFDSIIDVNTLGVLFGMMLFVAVIKQSGIFEFLAIKCAKLACGNPWRIMLLLIILTSVLSAFLDNVTTVLLIGPVTLKLCKLLKINPIPFFITQIIASNIGGTSTLIGDPPNIMIGSAANLSFVSFILIDGPCVLILLVIIITIFYFFYGRSLKVDEKNKKYIMSIKEHTQIKSTYLLNLSITMIVVIIIAFMFHDQLGLKSSIVAIVGAGVMLLLSRADIKSALSDVEWTTLTFFAGLFVIVGGLKQTGVISLIAKWLISITNENVFVLMLVLLFASAIISSILDNIPFVATLLPIITAMDSTIDVAPLWWAVSLGACLGGNGTLIGASANVVLSDISNKNGYPISFIDYTKVGFPIMLITVFIAGIYMIVRYSTIGF